MAQTLANTFTNGATIDDSTPSNPKLVIELRYLQNVGTGVGQMNGNGLNDVTQITAANADSYAGKIDAALTLYRHQAQGTTNDDPTVGTWIDFDPSRNKRFATRSSVSQIEWQPRKLIYQDDPTSTLDGDNVK